MKASLSGTQPQIVLEFMGDQWHRPGAGWQVSWVFPRGKKALLSDAGYERSDSCVDLGLGLAKWTGQEDNAGS